jgi:uncharacterized membrane protein YfhO
VPVHPAGGFFLGVLVERGEHQVTLAYTEPGLLRGALIGGATIVLLPLLLRWATLPASGRHSRRPPTGS